MTYTNPDNYWISSTALFIELNALANPNYIQANTNSGASILAYVKGIIDYDNGHNFRRWPLVASPTAFNSNTEKYVYVAIPRTEKVGTQAMVVFPSERIDIYGKAERKQDNGVTEEVQVGSEKYYYIYLEAVITSSGDDGSTYRDWKDDIRFNTGLLRSDEALSAGPTVSEWYEYKADLVTFLKDMTMTAGTKFLNLFAKSLSIVSGGSIQFAKGSVTEVADANTPATSTTAIVTPAYMGDRFLSKTTDDTAAGQITFKKGIDIFGNTVFGIYNKGISGATIQEDGFAEFGEVVIRSSLTVPQITYNNIEVIAGNTWRTPGGGTILNTTTIGSYNVAMLKLEDSQIGRIKAGDFCQGVWHQGGGKDWASADSDEHNGNFHFSGFTTVYFYVVEVYDGRTSPGILASRFGITESEVRDGLSRNMFFRYSLRCNYPYAIDGVTVAAKNLPASDPRRWTDSTIPQPQMDFSAYANRNDPNRQKCIYTTPDYEIMLVNMTDWVYGSDNISYIRGNLNGFSIMRRKKGSYNEATGEWEMEPFALQGWGLAFGRAYMWDDIQEIDRPPYIISQTLYAQFTQSENAPTDKPGEAGAKWVASTGAQSTDKDHPYLWHIFRYEYDKDDDPSVQRFSEPWLASRYVRDGTSITIKGSVLKFFESEEAFDTYDGKQTGFYAVNGAEGPKLYYVSTPSDTPATVSVTTGDCYLNAEDGHLLSAGDTQWVDVGNIRGSSIIARYAAPAEDGSAPAIEFIDDTSVYHANFTFGDVFMRMSLDGGDTWGDAVRIVGEEGTPGEHTDYSYAISADLTTASATTAPTITGDWADAPVATTAAAPYLWMRAQRVDGDGNSLGNPVYIRLTGEEGDDGEAVIVSIFSRSGSFQIPKGGSVELYAVVLKNGVDITSTILPNYFSWVRSSSDPTYTTKDEEGVSLDDIWNGQHEGIGPVLTLEDSDVTRMAAFDCIVTYENS